MRHSGLADHCTGAAVVGELPPSFLASAGGLGECGGQTTSQLAYGSCGEMDRYAHFPTQQSHTAQEHSHICKQQCEKVCAVNSASIGVTSGLAQACPTICLQAQAIPTFLKPRADFLRCRKERMKGVADSHM